MKFLFFGLILFSSALPISAFLHLNLSCPSNTFDCGNGNCIAYFWRCDGEDDCGNWADEHSCDDLEKDEPPKTCPPNHTNCNDTRQTCIPNKWLCDGMIDCDDGTDEQSCTKENVKCMGFLCQNFECIPNRWKCDGIPDCKDASDELDCRKQDPKICDKEHGFYKCITGECISHLKVCDKNKDCPQGDDEGTECRPDGCHNKNCSHLCTIEPHGPQCYCREGYRLSKDNTTCLDIDECATNRKTGICSQTCINRIGDYKCQCFSEYKLVDNKSCIAKEGEPLILFSNSEGIRAKQIRGNSREYFPVYHSLGQTVGLDVLNAKERVFWVNLDRQGSGIYSVGLDEQNFQPIVTNGLKSPEDIAVDWIGDNLYVTDAGLKALVVCHIDGGVCVSHLFGQLDRPRAVVVDPPNGLVYWSEWGNASGIYRAGMDGSDKRHLIADFIWPNGLALDRVDNRLYWTEAKLGKIEFLDLVTNERRVVLSDQVFHPFALDVFEDWIYWSDWYTFSLNRNHKISGHNETIIARDRHEEIKGVHVFHTLTQKKSYNPCWLHSCSHMCVLAPNRSHSCVCPEHLVLAKDKKTCIPKANDTFLMISVGEEVKMLYPEAIGSDVFIDAHIERGIIIGDITLDWKRKNLYIFDSKRLVIGSWELEESTFDHKNIEHDHHWVPIITSQLESVEGLTYDAYTDQLYWLESKEGILEVSTTDGKSRAVIIEGLERPIDLALHPEHRRMYVAVMGTDPHIMVSDMDGHNMKVLVASKTGFAVSLALDRINQILYWADAKNGLIEYIKPLASKGDPHRKGAIIRNLGHVMSLAVRNDTIFWTDIDSDSIYHQSIHEGHRHQKISVNIAHNGKAVKKLLMAVPENVTERDSPCLKKKGGCSHICLLGRFGPTCRCPLGYVILGDGQTCEKHNEVTDNSVLCTDCVTSGEVFDFVDNEDDFNWFTEDEDREADVLFARYDSKQRENESNVEKNNDVSTDRSSTAQTYVTTNPTKTTAKPTQVTTKAPKRVDQRKPTKTGRKKAMDKVIKSKAKDLSGKSDEKHSEEIVNTDPMGREVHDSHKRGWLTLFVAALIFAIVVILVAIIVKKDEYRDYRGALTRRVDQFQDVIVRFRRPRSFLWKNRNRDEEEPLSCDNERLNEEKY